MSVGFSSSSYDKLIVNTVFRGELETVSVQACDGGINSTLTISVSQENPIELKNLVSVCFSDVRLIISNIESVSNVESIPEDRGNQDKRNDSTKCIETYASQRRKYGRKTTSSKQRFQAWSAKEEEEEEAPETKESR